LIAGEGELAHRLEIAGEPSVLVDLAKRTFEIDGDGPDRDICSAEQEEAYSITPSAMADG
jgi:hypothetical protein